MELSLLPIGDTNQSAGRWTRPARAPPSPTGSAPAREVLLDMANAGQSDAQLLQQCGLLPDRDPIRRRQDLCEAKGSTYSSRPRRSSETEVISTAEITFARHRRPSLRWIRSTAPHWEAPREVQRRRTPTHDQQAPWGKSRGLQEEENKKAMNCSRDYGGSNAIGNGEVDSSILSGSTIHSLAKSLKIQHNSRLRPIVSFDHFSHFEQNRPRRRVPTDTKLAHRFYFCLRPFRPGLRALCRPPTRRPLPGHGAALGTGAD
jgi:hypothetical protein